MKTKFLQFVKLLANKYFLALFIFVVWLVFFDKNRLQIQLHLSNQIHSLQKDKEYYEQEKVKVDKELKYINNNIEKYAREKYFMKKKDEEVFIIEK